MSTPTATEPSQDQRDYREILKSMSILIILVGLIALLAALSGGRSLQPQNLSNIVVQVAPIGIVALGMMFAIITKGIDLSVGSIVGLAAVVAASLAQVTSTRFQFERPVILSIVVGLLIGALVGLVNGAIIAYFKIAPFIATLGMMTIARGLALIYTEGRPISNLAPGFNALGSGIVPIVIFLIVAIVIHTVLARTRFGRYVYAIGGNDQAARVSGVNIARVQVGIYTLIGLLSGLAGLILAARIESGNPQLGTTLELDAITAAVIGGTSFNGGIGKVWGVVVGALIIGIINNGLDLMNVSPFWQMVVKGVIIIAAIILDERKNS